MPRLRLLAGLLLMGQGLLVVTRVLDHEAPVLLGWGILVLGLVLAAWGRASPFSSPRTGPPLRARLVALLGASAVAGVVLYNALARSTLGAPELAILAYGAALLAAAPALDRRVLGTDVGTLVAFSFPLALAPLSLYALNAALASQASATPLSWYIHYTLVEPMDAGLSLAGLETSLRGDTVRILTPRGPLFLSVGVVCAGLYASVLFLGVFALFAWERRTPPARLAAYLAVGLLGLHAANVLRLVLLGLVGHRWGGAALQTFHEHAGWVLFLLWSVGFWAVVLRRMEGPGPRTSAPSPPTF